MAHSMALDQASRSREDQASWGGVGGGNGRFNSRGGRRQSSVKLLHPRLPALLQESVVKSPCPSRTYGPMRQKRRLPTMSSEQKQKAFKEIVQQRQKSRSVRLLASAVTAGSPARNKPTPPCPF